MSITLRTFSRLALSATLAGVVATASRPAAAERRVRIKLGTLAPRGSEWLSAIERMGRRWKEASGGKVQLKVYPGGVLGDESEMVRKMGAAGQLQAATITNLGLGTIDRATVALQVPMMFRSYEELDHVREALAPELEARLAEKGFVVLDWGDAGWVHFFSKKPVRTPEDLASQKLFVPSGDPQSEAAWRAADFNVVPTSSSDVIQGLQTGRLEAFATVPLYALASQWFALAPNMLALKWSPLAGATVVQKDVWEKIEPELRAKLKKIAVEETAQSRAAIRSMGEKATKAMKDRGLKVIEPTPEMVEKWRATAREAYPAIRGDVVPEAMFAKVEKLLERYREKNKKGKEP